MHAGFETLRQIRAIESATPVAQRWLREHADDRFFLFFHSYEVHPYFHRWTFADYPMASDRFHEYRYEPEIVNAADATPDEIAWMTDRYDGAVHHFDLHLEPLLGTLRELGRLDDTLVVVLADHGEDLWDHHGFLHGNSLYDELLRVPLVLRGPGIEGGRRIGAQVSVTDVAPTLLDLLGVPCDAPMDGASFAPLLRGAPDPRAGAAFGEAVAHGVERKAIRTPDFKYIRSFPDQRRSDLYDAVLLPAAPEELYDLRADPGETVDVAAERPDVLADLRARMDAILADLGETAGDAGTAANDEDDLIREQLAALGYVHG
jgi:arylsulfatase A-like enzyme